MNLIKSYEFFKPEMVKGKVHIVGCGSVGSTVAENLARCGVSKFVFWDFDRVEEHNIVNQMFTADQVGMAKVEALFSILKSINPDVQVELKPEGWNGEKMSGYIFLCVDSIDIRREIVTKHFNNMNVKAVFDFRTLLESAQHYAADWSSLQMKENLLKTMNFTHEEAAEEAPVSACGTTLGVATTVRLVSAMGVNNFIRFIKGEEIWRFVQIDGFHGILDAF